MERNSIAAWSAGWLHAYLNEILR